MSLVICSQPECQTTAGCKCAALWNPHQGYVMSPTPDKATRVASIICGHDYVQRMPEDEQALFYIFIKEVLGSKYV